MNQEADDLTAFLDKRLSEVEASPLPSPSPDASPVPSPTPLAVQDDGLITLVQQVHTEEQGTRIATSGSFIALCLILSILLAMMLFLALRKR